VLSGDEKTAWLNELNVPGVPPGQPTVTIPACANARVEVSWNNKLISKMDFTKFLFIISCLS
jgi:hypothetical protein